MPASVTETQSYTTTVQGPAGGDPRTAASVRAMGTPLASRTLWLKNQLARLMGDFQTISAVSAAADTLTITGHGLSEDDPVRIYSVGGVVPTGLLDDRVYYVVYLDADTIKLSSSAAGGALPISDAGSGTLYLFTVANAAGSIFLQSGYIGGSVAGYLQRAAPLSEWFDHTMSIYGGVFAGAVSFLQGITIGGPSAVITWRNEDLNNAASQTITGTAADWWHMPDVLQDSVYEVLDPTAAGQVFEVTRTLGTQAFKGDLVREDASVIARFPASAKGSAVIRSADTGTGLMWHCVHRDSNISVYS